MDGNMSLGDLPTRDNPDHRVDGNNAPEKTEIVTNPSKTVRNAAAVAALLVTVTLILAYFLEPVQGSDEIKRAVLFGIRLPNIMALLCAGAIVPLIAIEGSCRFRSKWCDGVLSGFLAGALLGNVVALSLGFSFWSCFCVCAIFSASMVCLNSFACRFLKVNRLVVATFGSASALAIAAIAAFLAVDDHPHLLQRLLFPSAQTQLLGGTTVMLLLVVIATVAGILWALLVLRIPGSDIRLVAPAGFPGALRLVCASLLSAVAMNSVGLIPALGSASHATAALFTGQIVSVASIGLASLLGSASLFAVSFLTMRVNPPYLPPATPFLLFIAGIGIAASMISEKRRRFALLEAGRRYLLDGQPHKAVAVFQGIAREWPDDPSVNGGLADSYAQIGHYDLALECYQKAGRSEEVKHKLYSLVDSLEENRRYEDAERALLAIVSLDEGYRDCGTRLAHLRRSRTGFQAVLSRIGISVGDAPTLANEFLGADVKGRFEPLLLCGTGGTGIVLKARDATTGHFVALKFLRADADNHSVERFAREIRLLNSLQHPSIVKLIDADLSAQPYPWLCLEYAQNGSLRSLLMSAVACSRSLDTYAVLSMGAYICGALSAAHAQGVIHRDVKPENILVFSWPQGESIGDIPTAATGMNPNQVNVKLADFGIAHIEGSTMTQTGHQPGTPRYMAPEQFLGTSTDARTDIYAMGLVLYECLTGAPPFVRGDFSHQHTSVAPQRPSGVSLALNAILLRCLSKTPEDRYVTAEGLGQALKEAMMSYSTLDQHPTPQLQDLQTIGDFRTHRQV